VIHHGGKTGFNDSNLNVKVRRRNQAHPGRPALRGALGA